MQDKYEVLKKYFGYENFRPGQEEVIDSILAGRDFLAVMPTGAGKSLCYQVPALLFEGITLVISPLISLMKDQVQGLNQAGVHAAYINSSLTEGQIRKALDLASQGRYKIIYVAPERLETEGFLSFAAGSPISMVAVDEAHCISQWGQDFRPSYLNIPDFIGKLAHRPVVCAFTATATDRVMEDIRISLRLEEPKSLVTGFDRPNLYYGVEVPGNKKLFLEKYLKGHEEDSGIIYCATRKNVDKLYELFLSQGIQVRRYHAGLSNEDRQQAQDDFIYGRARVMVATNAFGMGIDKPDVRYVIHYNMPQSLENYYQEAGRAGRDGDRAECILLFSNQDIVVNRLLLEHSTEDGLISENDQVRLQQMVAYCKWEGCLRDYLLKYFGEEGCGEGCGNCSGCNIREEDMEDVTEEAKKAIICIKETGQRFGAGMIAATLHGSLEKKLLDRHLDQASAYGCLSGLSLDKLKRILARLESGGYIRATEDKYRILKLKEKAGRLFASDGRVLLKKEEEMQKAGKGQQASTLNERGLALFDLLKDLRRKLAEEASVPPYLIFSDKSLVDMCIRTPLNEGEMLQVFGLGANKYQSYGEKFLSVISAFTGGSHELLYEGDMEEPVYFKPVKKKNADKEDFYLTSEEASRYQPEPDLNAAAVAARLSALRDADNVKKLFGTDITRLLLAEGYAEEHKNAKGYLEKGLTDKGTKLGLVLIDKESKKGNVYKEIIFPPTVQEWLLERYRR